MKILVTNDDGITAPGIRHLVEIASQFGEVIVVAPDKPQSGQGHAITLNQPLRLNRTDIFGDIEAYECSGTPVDCVKLAKNVLLKGQKVDLCVSGINHGSNAGINIIYSGTMSAAMEASLEGIESIGFSLCDYGWDADFSHALPYIRDIVAAVLDKGLQHTKLLNVNIPPKTDEPIQGVKVCRQADATWVEDFSKQLDPRGEPYYWLTGKFVNLDKKEDNDVAYLEKRYITIVPSGHDLTTHAAIDPMKFLEI